jgi:hypothetical protein
MTSLLVPAAKKAVFSWNQVILQWSVGMVVAVPVTALLQGGVMLNDYRLNHGDAPRPLMPARGVAVAVSENESAQQKSSLLSWRRQSSDTSRPLRLLVVGDSLAAGVGISKSGTPILPESIARALSLASGGRVVYWTCVGTPGISASQIVQDINQIEPQKSGRLELLLREWQAKRKRWMQRQQLKRRQTQLQNEQLDFEEIPKNPIARWWKEISARKTPKEIGETTRNVAQEWWTSLTTRVKEDLDDIKELVQSKPQEFELEDESKKEDPPLIQKGFLFRRDTLDPQVASQYDIAVVLMGLNDVKDMFMPVMMKGKNAPIQSGTVRIHEGLVEQLHHVLNALKSKMGRMDLEKEQASQGSESDPSLSEKSAPEYQAQQHMRRPLVVVPALPVAPLQLFRIAPLKWFLVPIFQAMEHSKRALSESFPELVVFVPQPTREFWSDVEAGRGAIREGLENEKLLFKLNDVAQNARDRIQQLMKQHYGNWPVDADEERHYEHRDYPHDHNHPHHSDHQREGDQDGPSVVSDNPGSTLIAVDGMHPNDEGYDIWGRHIASAIVQHWNE